MNIPPYVSCFPGKTEGRENYINTIMSYFLDYIEKIPESNKRAVVQAAMFESNLIATCNICLSKIESRGEKQGLADYLRSNMEIIRGLENISTNNIKYYPKIDLTLPKIDLPEALSSLKTIFPKREDLNDHFKRYMECRKEIIERTHEADCDRTYCYNYNLMSGLMKDLIMEAVTSITDDIYGDEGILSADI